MKTCYTCVYAKVGYKSNWLGDRKKGVYCARFPPHPKYGPPKANGLWGCGEHVAKPPELNFEERLTVVVEGASKRLDNVNTECRREVAYVQIKLQWALAREMES